MGVKGDRVWRGMKGEAWTQERKGERGRVSGFNLSADFKYLI